jgi:hypothetical protein
MTTMTPGRWINLVAAVLGAIGAIVLFDGSFAYESRTVWTDEQSVARRNKRNRHRQIMQRIGIWLILASFVVQGAAQFFD